MKDNNFYMFPPTGAVLTMHEWKEDQREQGYPDSDLEMLVPVIKDIEGDWVDWEP